MAKIKGAKIVARQIYLHKIYIMAVRATTIKTHGLLLLIAKTYQNIVFPGDFNITESEEEIHDFLEDYDL